MSRRHEEIGKTIRVTVDEAKCTGCQMCKMDCAARHSGRKDLPVCYPQSWELLGEGKLSLSLCEISQAGQLCQECTDTPCVTICPTGAVRVLEVRQQFPSRPRQQNMGRPKGKTREVSAHV